MAIIKFKQRISLVLPYQFIVQNYGFAFKDNSPYDEIFNQALLKVRKSPEGQKALNDYFGGFF